MLIPSCVKEINSYKERGWTADSPMDDNTLKDFISDADKEEDAARKAVKDIEDKIHKEPKQALKKAIRTKEDLTGKKKALETKETASLNALKAKHLKERAIHVLQLQTVKGLVVSVRADQDQLKAYKAAVVAIKMPKAV